jgi:microcystin-dependent protein
MQAALPMGANKITGMADPTVATDAATKAYADALVAAFFSTGDLKPTIKAAPDSGWLMLDDGTFGSATSGSSNSNSAANQALFTLIFNNITDGSAPIFTSGGGATTRAAQTNAASAWAANCRMSLPKALGRALGIAGNNGTPGTFGAWALGQTFGAEKATLATANLPPYTPTGSISVAGSVGVSNAGPYTNSFGAGSQTILTAGGANPIALSITSQSFTGNAQGGTSAPVTIIQPTIFVNCMIKL